MSSIQQIGVHVSIAGGIANSVSNAKRIGCTAFQIFTRNPRGWKAKKLDPDDIEIFTLTLSESDINAESVIVHMPYLPNLSAPDGESYRKSIKTLELEAQRCLQLRISKLIIHLGSHMGTGQEKGSDQVVRSLQHTVDKLASEGHRGANPIILLENSAGQKNSIGSRFEDLRKLLDRLNDSRRFGVCFDTCHAFVSGYDLRSSQKVHSVMDEFDSRVGLKEMKVAHLNDSKGDIGSNLDRHEHIGIGKIGLEGLSAFLNHRRIKQIPTILETPIVNVGDDEKNLAIAKKLIGR